MTAVIAFSTGDVAIVCADTRENDATGTGYEDGVIKIVHRPGGILAGIGLASATQEAKDYFLAAENMLVQDLADAVRSIGKQHPWLFFSHDRETVRGWLQETSVLLAASLIDESGETRCALRSVRFSDGELRGHADGRAVTVVPPDAPPETHDRLRDGVADAYRDFQSSGDFAEFLGEIAMWTASVGLHSKQSSTTVSIAWVGIDGVVREAVLPDLRDALDRDAVVRIEPA